MALIATVSKANVAKVMDKMWNISMNMTLTDDASEVINKDYSVRYRTGDPVAAKESEFIALMQADINKYKSEKGIYDAPAFGTAVTNVGAGLVV